MWPPLLETRAVGYAKYSEVTFVAMWWTLLLILGTAYAGKICEPEFFFNTTSEQCQRCSKCSEGELMRRTCSEINDTLCGLINFSFSDAADGHPASAPGKRREVTPTLLVDDDEKYWRTLAFALIGLLSVLVIVSSVVVFVTCYKFRHTGWFCKHVPPEPEDVENGYVVIHKFIPDAAAGSSASSGNTGYNSNLASDASAQSSSSSQSQDSQPFIAQQRSNRPYRPKRRLMNEYIDDVFESDDSGGSRSLRLHLETIPERSESN